MNVEMIEGQEQEALIATFGHPVRSSPFYVLPCQITVERSEVRFAETGLSFRKQL
jgi:hypothetical protein